MTTNELRQTLSRLVSELGSARKDMNLYVHDRSAFEIKAEIREVHAELSARALDSEDLS